MDPMKIIGDVFALDADINALMPKLQALETDPAFQKLILDFETLLTDSGVMAIKKMMGKQ